MKYRKKPIVIEAEQFLLHSEKYPEGVEPVWVNSNHPDQVLGPQSAYLKNPGWANLAFGVKTINGWVVVTHEEWIITGVQGEKYPCKDDIFERTYEPVE